MNELSILNFTEYKKLLNCQSMIDKVICKYADRISDEQRDLLSIISAAIEVYVEYY